MKKQTDSKKGPNQNESLDNCPLKLRKECEIPSNAMLSSFQIGKGIANENDLGIPKPDFLKGPMNFHTQGAEDYHSHIVTEHILAISCDRNVKTMTVEAQNKQNLPSGI